jgi:hypothetical protein
MERKNFERVPGGRPAPIENCNGLSDAVIIEIIQSIKEIIIKFIDQKYQLGVYHDGKVR